MRTERAPQTLLEAVKYFANPDVAHGFVAALRYPNNEVSCPRCESKRQSFLATRRVWKCLDCKKQFSVKVGTIFEDSPLPLEKWLPAMWMLVNAKNGISSYELARAVGVTQKTAWFMLHRIRLAMQTKSFAKSSGPIEADETFIGGKARNMHKAKRDRIKGTKGRLAMVGKIAVMGLLERHGKDGHSAMRTTVVPNTRRATLQGEIINKVEPHSTVYTDANWSYAHLSKNSFVHHVIDHAEKYVDGQIHTNGCENFWSLLKRSLNGTYVSVEPFHLFRYLDEQTYRFNRRKMDDAGRFILAAASIFGRRVTYKALTGKLEAQTC